MGIIITLLLILLIVIILLLIKSNNRPIINIPNKPIRIYFKDITKEELKKYVSAQDDYDGILTDEIEIDISNILTDDDKYIPGIYKVKYSVTNSFGNKIEIDIYIEIFKKLPSINIPTNSNFDITIDNDIKCLLKDVNVADDYEDLTNYIYINHSIPTEDDGKYTPGTYKVTY